MLMFKMVPRSDLRRVSGERKQGELCNICSTLGMVREWRKRQHVSWECKYWSLFSGISRVFDCSDRILDAHVSTDRGAKHGGLVSVYLAEVWDCTEHDLPCGGVLTGYF